MGSATYNVLVFDSRNPVSNPDAGYTIGANKKMRCVGVDEYSGAQELSVSAYIQFDDGLEVSKRRVRAEVDVLEDTAIFNYLAAAVEPAWPSAKRNAGTNRRTWKGFRRTETYTAGIFRIGSRKPWYFVYENDRVEIAARGAACRW